MRSATSHSVLSVAIRQAATSSAAACILDARGAYLFANDAWQKLESERSGAFSADPLVGAALLDRLENDDVRGVWGEALQCVLSGAARSRVITSEHNGPDVARLLCTRVEPIASAHGILGLILARATVRERPIADLYAVSSRDAAAFTDAEGRVSLCPCCRRARDGADRELWEIVPRWVVAPPASARWRTCELCAELHLALHGDAAEAEPPHLGR